MMTVQYWQKKKKKKKTKQKKTNQNKLDLLKMKFIYQGPKKFKIEVPVVETNLTRNHEVMRSMPAIVKWDKDPVLL